MWRAPTPRHGHPKSSRSHDKAIRHHPISSQHTPIGMDWEPSPLRVVVAVACFPQLPARPSLLLLPPSYHSKSLPLAFPIDFWAILQLPHITTPLQAEASSGSLSTQYGIHSLRPDQRARSPAASSFVPTFPSATSLCLWKGETV